MTGPRPRHLVVVTGTGTEVGKTWWTAGIARLLRDTGSRVAARKPAQSFDPDDRTTDAAELGTATAEAPTTVCPAHRWYELPMAPPMAAAALGRPGFSIADLAGELTWPPGIDVGLVETAGGPRSPLADDGDTVTLVGALAPDVTVLVADAGLGTINAVRLCTAALATAVTPPTPVIVALNRYDAELSVHRANLDWLRTDPGLPVVTDVGELAARLAPAAYDG